jgi:hypothetical protein
VSGELERRLRKLEQSVEQRQAQRQTESRWRDETGAEMVTVLWDGAPTYTIMAELWDAWPEATHEQP